jgi:hypothetical protein
MKIRTYIVATILGLAALLPSVCQAKAEYLKEEPPKGAIPYGKIVYVDDGTCPSGEVKEITGGSLQRSIPRKVRCVKRPD